MEIVLSVLSGLVVGFIVGALVMRKHAAKFEAALADAMAEKKELLARLDALKRAAQGK